MKITDRLNSLLLDLENFRPNSLSHLVRFVRGHSEFYAITMLASNVERSAQILYDHCELLKTGLIARLDQELADIELASLLVIAVEVDGVSTINRFEKLLSSTSEESGEYYWSRGIAASYLLHKEVTNETIRQSA